MNYTFTTGSKIRFAEENRPYTVKACNKRFAICTKPYNPKKTVLVTIVDLKKKVRGTEDLVFSPGYDTDELCKQALARFKKGESQVSQRNNIPLRIMN